MKSTGIIRPIDNLGRIVLPIELRRNLDISNDDALEIYVDGNSIILKKHVDSCLFCGNSKGLVVFKEKCLCQKCLDDLADRY